MNIRGVILLTFHNNIHGDLKSLLDFALELARTAENRILPRYQGCDVMIKPDGSEVTVADREAETAMRDLICQRYPSHKILGEEYGSSSSEEADFLWVLDPIDGTASFTLGVPLFGTLVALLRRGNPVLGVIHMPVLRETTYAATGLGCWFRTADFEPVRLRVVKKETLGEAVVSAGGIHASDLQPETDRPRYRLSTYIQTARKFRFIADCAQHALVCRGRLQAALDPVMYPWDNAAIVPCIREAGGKATTVNGDEDNVVFGGSLLISCGEPLHTELVQVLQPRI